MQEAADELVTLSEGARTLDPNVRREGFVLRPLAEEHDEIGGRLRFEDINPRLLPEDDE